MRFQADQRWNELRRDWHACVFARRVGVLAAHPDDETIGASALLARCSKTTVIFLTDGAPKDRHLWPPDFHGAREEYVRCRRREAEAAMACAGVSPGHITWLGAVDQEAIFSASRLTEALAQIAVECELEVLVTHPYEGGHPDHDAAALITSVAAAQLPKLAHLEMTSYHARGDRCETGEFLDPDPDREFVFEFSQQDITRKRQMFNAYESQKLVLSSFSVDRERLRLAPKYDFAHPPHEGRLWYERLGWPLTGGQWRILAEDALRSTQVFHAADRA